MTARAPRIWYFVGAAVSFAASLAADQGPGGLFSSGSSAEAKADRLFVAALTPTTPYVELSGQRIPISEAWLERKSTAVTEEHRRVDPGTALILVLRFNVPRSQGKLLLTYFDPRPDGGGGQAHEGAVILIEDIRGDLPRVAVHFREHFAPDRPILFTLDLRREGSPQVSS